MTDIRVLVAEDDLAVRALLVDLIAAERGLELAATAADGEAAVEAALRTLPDVVILDLHMPRGGGTRAAAEIRLHLPHARLVVFSADPHGATQALRSGADEYLVKGAPVDEILAALRRGRRDSEADRLPSE